MSTTGNQTLRRRYCIDDSIAIWFNPVENAEYKEKIEHIFSETHVFGDRARLIDFISTIKMERIILIVSGQIDQDFIKSIMDFKQIAVIYTFGEMNSSDEETNLKKFAGNFKSIEDLCQVAGEKKRRMEDNRVKVTISKANNNEISPALIYSELLKDVLLNLRYDDNVKENFADFAKSQHPDNRITLENIEKFRNDKNYSPIWWYTCESFLYSMLNGALRNQDIDVLHQLGFFIRDLHKQLHQLQLHAPFLSSVTLYRGQGLNRKDFQQIQSTPNGILSFQHFLSTSRIENFARIRAESTAQSDELVGILFQMAVDPTVCDIPFASIDNESVFGSGEAEVLFSINTIFRIGQIEALASNLYRIHLNLIANNDPDMQHLIEYLREEISTNENPLHRFGQLTLRMQEWSKAKELYQNLLNHYIDIGHTDGTVHSYHQLGYIHFQLDDFDIALEYLQKSLDILKKYHRSSLPDVANTYSLIGEVYFQQKKDFETALKYMQEALKRRLKQYKPDHQTLAKNYNQIGETLLYLKRHDEALVYLNKALELQLRSLPKYHMDLASTYHTISHVYHDNGEYDQALSYCEKALDIYKRCLRPNHPTLASVHTNMANNFGELTRFDEGIFHITKAIEISQTSLSFDQEKIQERQRILNALQSSKRNKENSLVDENERRQIHSVDNS